MEVRLLHKTPVAMAVVGALTCTANTSNMWNRDWDKLIKSLIDRGHESVLEHVVFTFEIKDISRALLQEVARHRIASLSVQSTRWALHKKMQSGESPLMFSDVVERLTPETLNSEVVNKAILNLLALMESVEEMVKADIPNDIVKYFLPECVTTSLQLTINVRSLRNMFKLRSAPQALWEFQMLMTHIMNAIPKTHHVFFEDIWGSDKAC